MANKVHGKKKNFENSLFHFALIKLLVLEELKKRSLDWEAFLLSKGISVEVVGIPHAKKRPLPLFRKTLGQEKGHQKRIREKGKDWSRYR